MTVVIIYLYYDNKQTGQECPKSEAYRILDILIEVLTLQTPLTLHRRKKEVVRRLANL